MTIKEYLFLYDKKPHFELLYKKLLTTTDMFNSAEKGMITTLFNLKYEDEFEVNSPELAQLHDIVNNNLLSNQAQYSRVRLIPNLIPETVKYRYKNEPDTVKNEKLVSSILKLYELNSFTSSLIAPLNIRERLCAYMSAKTNVTFDVPDLELPFYLATLSDNYLQHRSVFKANIHRITPLIMKKAIVIATILGRYELKVLLTKGINSLINISPNFKLDLEYEYVRLFSVMASMQYVPFNITSKESIDRFLGNKLGSSSYNSLNNKFHSIFFAARGYSTSGFNTAELMEVKTICYHLISTNFPLNRTYYDFFIYLFAALNFKELKVTDKDLTEGLIHVEASKQLSKFFKRNTFLYPQMFGNLEKDFPDLYQMLLYKGDIYAKHENPVGLL